MLFRSRLFSNTLINKTSNCSLQVATRPDSGSARDLRLTAIAAAYTLRIEEASGGLAAGRRNEEQSQMTDDTVDKEIEENQRRKDEHDENDDGTLVGAVEGAFTPLTDALATDDDDDESAVERRDGNDADQRP